MLTRSHLREALLSSILNLTSFESTTLALRLTCILMRLYMCMQGMRLALLFPRTHNEHWRRLKHITRCFQHFEYCCDDYISINPMIHYQLFSFNFLHFSILLHFQCAAIRSAANFVHNCCQHVVSWSHIQRKRSLISSDLCRNTLAQPFALTRDLCVGKLKFVFARERHSHSHAWKCSCM